MSENLRSGGHGATATLRDECERAAVIELRAYKRRRQLKSAKALADHLGCSEDSAARYLSGKSGIPGWVVIAIRRAA